MNENENPNVNEEPVVAPAPQPQPEAPVYASPIPEEPVKKKGFPKVLLIVLAVLAVGAIAFFGIRAAASGKPLNKVALGAKKTAEALEKSAPFALAENLGNSGSVAVSIDLSKLSDVIAQFRRGRKAFAFQLDTDAVSAENPGITVSLRDGYVENARSSYPSFNYLLPGLITIE